MLRAYLLPRGAVVGSKFEPCLQKGKKFVAGVEGVKFK